MSLHHFESEVGGARRLDQTCPPQFDSLRVEIVEEPDTAPLALGDAADALLRLARALASKMDGLPERQVVVPQAWVWARPPKTR